MQLVQYKKASIKRALAGALIMASTLVAGEALSQSFPPFPEPAVGPFPDTENMRLLDQLLPDEIGAVTPRSGVLLNDIWGWTSPNGEEYALVGTGDGMSIVRVTDPKNPVFIGIMPTPEPDDFANLWGDVAVYNAGMRRDGDDDDDAAPFIESFHRLLGDFNGNAIVDFADFIALQEALAAGSEDPLYDLNCDGLVDFGDFLTFSAVFGDSV